MKGKIFVLSIVFLGTILLTGCIQASNWENLEKKLNPGRKKLWVVVIDQETFKFFRDSMKRYGVSKVRGFGLGAISLAEGLIQPGYPSIVTFSPDQISQDSFKRFVKKKYHYLFVIPIKEIKKILAEDKCVIVSRKERIITTREVLDKEWVVISKTEEERFITLVAAPDKESLKKAFTHLLNLKEIPLEPIIFRVE